ncbi:putative F-box/FBD/LRR-repeat protein At5g62970 isoform X2 [Cornus florida]|nr:putative F-box/FBD/LRR-repeat protein At5g62970 isoform X2 [Cornus florida]
MNEELLEVERSRYISWVNKVLESHRGSTIDEFRVSFYLNISSSCVIDRWIEFAIAKCVQRLEMDFEPCTLSAEAAGIAYTFPNQSYIHIKSPAGLSSIRSLRSLCFKRVNISGEILEYFLSNCPLLESLLVESSEHLVNFKVIGSSLRLKFLEISFCPNLMGLEVCATSLVSFKYFGLRQRVNMQIKDAFQLAELSISNHIDPIDSAFFPFSSYFSQLETLSFGMDLSRWKRGNRGLKQLPEFTKLKQLTLEVIADESTSILGWTTLINASPSLHKLKLKLCYWGPRAYVERKLPKVCDRPLQCLKEVELAGFVGCLVDLELAQYLIKNAVRLERIIIDRHCTHILGIPRPWMFMETEKKEYAREQAIQLQKSLPARVKMDII